MDIIKIGYDNFLKKEVRKIKFNSEEIPKIQLFNSNDVIVGNPSSNVAVGFIYTWKEDHAPKEIMEFFQRVSNYSYMTGFWKTTNGARYVFSNILANPNVNKLVILIFGCEDNGHLLVDSLIKFWRFGLDENKIIKNCNAPNPKFEQVPEEALERIKKQVDLIVAKNLSLKDSEKIERLIRACYQEPRNAVDSEEFADLGIEFISSIDNSRIYDSGIKFEDPYYINLVSGAANVNFEKRELITTVGQSIQANDIEDAFSQIAAFIFKNGSAMQDERDIVTMESRSFTATIMDPLSKIPESFSKEYLDKYAEEFMNGVGEKLDDFAYTYHERIFKRWGNQVERAIKVLKERPKTRRTLISLWDPSSDLESSNPPCLDFIWLVVRNDKLECHIVYRSHHLATVTKDGRVMKGEGAFVPNMYALAKLQEYVAKELNMHKGPLILTDFSGHLYVSSI